MKEVITDTRNYPLAVKAQWERLEPWLRNLSTSQQVPPVTLLTGPFGIRSQEIVRFLAQGLLCEKDPFQLRVNQEESATSWFGDSLPDLSESDSSLIPCGECGACGRAHSHAWIDYLEISAEPGSQTIKLDQFGDLKAQVALGSSLGGYRVIGILGAERMTLQASNSLLKLLEEPPSKWIFLLTSHEPTLLPITIRSRAQILRLLPVPSEVLGEYARSERIQLSEEVASQALSSGSFEHMKELLDPGFIDQRKLLREFVEHPTERVRLFQPLFEWGSFSTENYEHLLDEWVRILHERITKELGQHQVGLKNDEDLNRVSRLIHARAKSHLPLSSKIQLQSLLLEWLEETR